MTWRPVDIVVLILSSTIGVSFIVTTIAPIILREPITDERAKVLSAIVTSAVAVISVYVGSEINGSP